MRCIIGAVLTVLVLLMGCEKDEKADQTSTGRQPVGEEARIGSAEETSNKVIPPQKGEKFELEIKTYAEVLEDQISYHKGNQTLTEEEVRNHFIAQRVGVQSQHPGGDVYAYGYMKNSKPLRVVYAPVNGGRIEPAESGTTDTIAFYDSQGRLLTYLTSPGGGDSYQTQKHGGSGSSTPRGGGGMRTFHYIFSVDSSK